MGAAKVHRRKNEKKGTIGMGEKGRLKKGGGGANIVSSLPQNSMMPSPKEKKVGKGTSGHYSLSIVKKGKEKKERENVCEKPLSTRR